MFNCILYFGTLQPSELTRRMRAVLQQFENMDPDTEFLTKQFDDAWDNAMSHVEKGCLSDPPGINMYIEVNGKIVTRRVCCSKPCA